MLIFTNSEKKNILKRLEQKIYKEKQTKLINSTIFQLTGDISVKLTSIAIKYHIFILNTQIKIKNIQNKLKILIISQYIYFYHCNFKDKKSKTLLWFSEADIYI